MSDQQEFEDISSEFVKLMREIASLSAVPPHIRKQALIMANVIDREVDMMLPQFREALQ